MRGAIVAGLVLAWVSGCACESADWHADARFTTEERSDIVAGATWLAEQSGTPVPSIDFTYDVASAQRLPHTIRRERGPDATGECVGGVGGTVYLGIDDPTVREVDRPGFAAHELAHCTLGFVDDASTDGIMRVLTPMRWTEREQAQCHVTTACGPV